MDNKELLQAIEYYQNLDMVHQLTCGVDSNHEDLQGVEVNGKVILKCKDCNYEQHYIPSQVVTVWQNKESFKSPFSK